MYRLLALALLFVLCLLPLSACKGQAAESPPSTTDPTQSAKKTIDVEGVIRLSLPDGLCAETIAQIPDMSAHLICTVLETQYNSQAYRAEADAAASLLTSDLADLVLLSPQHAATLYRNGTAVQVVAIVDPGTAGADNMSCLVGTTAFIEANHDLLQRFLQAYQEQVAQAEQEGAFCAIGWDMLDLVQAELEMQYLLYSGDADKDRSIPPGNFYFIP